MHERSPHSAQPWYVAIDDGQFYPEARRTILLALGATRKPVIAADLAVRIKVLTGELSADGAYVAAQDICVMLSNDGLVTYSWGHGAFMSGYRLTDYGRTIVEIMRLEP